jgi:hypothetical protein
MYKPDVDATVQRASKYCEKRKSRPALWIIEYSLNENSRYVHWVFWRGSLLQEGGENRGNKVHYSYVCCFIAFTMLDPPGLDKWWF